MKIVREKKAKEGLAAATKLAKQSVVEHKSSVGVMIVRNPLKLCLDVAGTQIQADLMVAADAAAIDRKGRSFIQVLSPVDSYRSSLSKRVRMVNGGRSVMCSVLYNSRGLWESLWNSSYPLCTAIAGPVSSNEDTSLITYLWSLRLSGLACPECTVINKSTIEHEIWAGRVRYVDVQHPIKWIAELEVTKAGALKALEANVETAKAIIAKCGYTIKILTKEQMVRMSQFGCEEAEEEDLFTAALLKASNKALNEADAPEEDPFAAAIAQAASEKKSTPMKRAASKTTRATPMKRKTAASSTTAKTINNVSMDDVGKNNTASVPPVKEEEKLKPSIEVASSSSGPATFVTVENQPKAPEAATVTIVSDDSDSDSSSSSSSSDSEK